MIVEQAQQVEQQIIANLTTAMKGGQSRDEGALHVSDLLFCLRKAVARKLGFKNDLSDTTTLLFAVGRGMQAYMSGEAKDADPVGRDGVVGTPDQLVIYGSDYIPREYKATYASAARDVEETPHYFQQLAAYCYMLGVTTGELVVLYLNGYYNFQRKSPHPGSKPGERAVVKAWRVYWTQEELEYFWQNTILQRKNTIDGILQWHAEVMQRAMRDPQAVVNKAAILGSAVNAVPIAYHWTFECEQCPLFAAGLCEGGPGSFDSLGGLR